MWAPGREFVTLFHTKKEEPLEKIAKAFFGRRWDNLSADSFRTLAVSRFLAASIVGQVAEQAFREVALTIIRGLDLSAASHPCSRVGPTSGSDIASFRRMRMLGRVGAPGAHRESSPFTSRTRSTSSEPISLLVLRCSRSLNSIAIELGGRYEEFIRILLRGLETPAEGPYPEQLVAPIVLGRTQAPPAPVVEADVHEALAALKRPCTLEIRASLPARRRRSFSTLGLKMSDALGSSAGKSSMPSTTDWRLAKWAADASLPGVRLWAEAERPIEAPILYVRIDDVDFSFMRYQGPTPFSIQATSAHMERHAAKANRTNRTRWARALRSPPMLPESSLGNE